MKFLTPLRGTALLLHALLALRIAAAEPTPIWLSPAAPGVTIAHEAGGKARIVSSADEFVLDSTASLPAKGGDAFAIEVRVKVGIDMSAQPELACFYTQNREVPSPVPVQAMRQSTTQWQ